MLVLYILFDIFKSLNFSRRNFVNQILIELDFPEGIVRLPL
jgi:hypothetical protein